MGREFSFILKKFTGLSNEFSSLQDSFNENKKFPINDIFSKALNDLGAQSNTLGEIISPVNGLPPVVHNQVDEDPFLASYYHIDPSISNYAPDSLQPMPECKQLTDNPDPQIPSRSPDFITVRKRKRSNNNSKTRRKNVVISSNSAAPILASATTVNQFGGSSVSDVRQNNEVLSLSNSNSVILVPSNTENQSAGSR